MKREIIMIEGMTCVHCEAAVAKAVKGTIGVTECIVDLRTNTAEIQYDSNKVNIQSIYRNIEEEGYKVIQENRKRCWSC